MKISGGSLWGGLAVAFGTGIWVGQTVVSRGAAGSFAAHDRKRLSAPLREVIARSVADEVWARLQERIQVMERQLEQRNAEIAELRERLALAEKTMVDLVQALGQVYRRAAEQIAPASVEEKKVLHLVRVPLVS